MLHCKDGNLSNVASNEGLIGGRQFSLIALTRIIEETILDKILTLSWKHKRDMPIIHVTLNTMNTTKSNILQQDFHTQCKWEITSTPITANLICTNQPDYKYIISNTIRVHFDKSNPFYSWMFFDLFDSTYTMKRMKTRTIMPST